MLRLVSSSLLGIWLLSGASVLAQDAGLSTKYAETITPQDLKKHLSVLASDEYEGRETARKGQKMAAKYIEEHFASLGLTPMGNETGFQQSFPVKITHPQGISVKVGGEELTRFEDYYNFFNGENGSYSDDDLIYLGYGINNQNYNDYDGVNVEGKIILVSSGEPKHKGDYWIGGKEVPTPWSYDWRAKSEMAGQKE
jgi:hypothetical protein